MNAKSPFIIVELKSEKPYGNSMAEYAFLTLEPLRVKFLSERILILLVYVISKSGKPLMPCKSVVARLLLKDGNARVVRREPFTIKLTRETTEYIQPLTLGVDVGARTSGFSVIDNKNNVLYVSEVVARDDIKDKMYARNVNRHTRRNRKTRYRKARFKNRKNSTKHNRLTPTIVSKVKSCVKEISYIESILPISVKVFELGKFNVAAMQNPNLLNPKIKHWGYRRGPKYGFENTRAMVLFRDGYECKVCRGKNHDHRLEVHHIVPKSKNGSDCSDNLITLCRTCHLKIHNGEININLHGRISNDLKYATQMNSIRVQLLKRYPEAIETFGYVTTANRVCLGFNKKTHWLDASIIATGGSMPIYKTNLVYIKRCNPKGDFKQTYGKHSEKTLNRRKMCGILKYDKVRYQGIYCFVKSRYDGRYGTVMDIYGNQITFNYLPWGKKTPKLANMVRIAARSSWMIATKQLKFN